MIKEKKEMIIKKINNLIEELVAEVRRDDSYLNDVIDMLLVIVRLLKNLGGEIL